MPENHGSQAEEAQELARIHGTKARTFGLAYQVLDWMNQAQGEFGGALKYNGSYLLAEIPNPQTPDAASSRDSGRSARYGGPMRDFSKGCVVTAVPPFAVTPEPPVKVRILPRCRPILLPRGRLSR